ncbi:hypothetical protein SDJN02_02123, partial [Cucurbita argyrosperma subsp. argyrosperma]
MGRFMKLRLDRVLAESYEADSLEQALASNPTNIEFEKPEKWVAPYPKYEYGWWEIFLPPVTKTEAEAKVWKAVFDYSNVVNEYDQLK